MHSLFISSPYPIFQIDSLKQLQYHVVPSFNCMGVRALIEYQQRDKSSPLHWWDGTKGKAQSFHPHPGPPQGEGVNIQKERSVMAKKGNLIKAGELANRGAAILHDPVRNKGMAFTEKERELLGLKGLLPPRYCSQDVQMMRVMENIRRKANDLERYIYLISLQDRNEALFYRFVIENLREMMPLLYTPTVGKACQLYGHIFRRPRGLFISAKDKGKMSELFDNWPHKDIRIIVVTDGERILGLGDLGANGMGIPVGKLTLYTLCAGIHPSQCLPITLDVGTNNKDLRKDPLYIGLPEKRLRGEAFDAFFDEFMTTAMERYPNAVIQLEDFANINAFRLLEEYRGKACLFDDDIQGTAAIALAGLYSSERITGKKLKAQRILFLGAGEAGIGIGSLTVSALMHEGFSEEEARERCWYFDSKGLVIKNRPHLASHKAPFAKDHEAIDNFLDAVKTIRPTTIIGVSGVAGGFSREVLEEMAKINERPIVFALSNPTSKSECSAKQAYTWTKGQAVFASGSPFDPVDFDGKTFVPGQGNNAYIFPGVGLGAISSRTTQVTDEMFFVAAKTLAGEVSDADLALGRIYPSLTRIREVSATIAEAVAEIAFREGYAREERPEDLSAYVRSQMFEPSYKNYVE